MFRRAFALLFALAALGLTACTPSGPVYYVSTTGSDSNPGTQAQPWRTIGASLPKLTPGDTLAVRGGTYVERVGNGTFLDVASGTSSSPIAVGSSAGENAVIQGLLWLDDPDHWTIDNLDVTWSSANTADEHMVRIRGGTGWTLRNSAIWGAASYANLNVTPQGSEPSGFLIAGNCIHDNVGDPSHGTSRDQLLYINTGLGSSGGVIERNLLFRAPRGKAIKLGGPDATSGSANVVVRFNTVYDTIKPSVTVHWKTKNSDIHRNLLVLTQDVGLVRGNELSGTGNQAHHNAGSQGPVLIYNDSGYPSSVADTGGNVFPLEPQFDSTASCSGFHPQNTAAQAFGRYAP